MATSLWAIKGVPAQTSETFGDIATAYDVWVEFGNEGTVQDFLNSLVGPQGAQGPEGPQGPKGETPDMLDGGFF